ncbi:MAG: methyl-accepting chemotaxis protein, partial [Burkholderiales bacterium]|nr:methyl-accepting chemotaxis protein [Burkholderiales bacterium]
MFSNLKIGARLGIGFGVVAALLIAVLWVGLSRMGLIAEHVRAITQENIPATEQVTLMQAGQYEMGVFVRNLLIVTEPNQLKKEYENFDGAVKHYKEAEAKLDNMFQTLASATDAEKAFMTKIKGLSTRAIPIFEQAADLGRQNKNAEAGALILGEVVGLGAQWRETMKELAAFERAFNENAAKQAAAAYDSARTLMLIIGAVALVSAALLAFIVTRSVVHPIRYAVGISNALAAGDLTTRVEVSSKDETGLLLTAMQNMVGKLSHIISEVRSG